VVEKERRDFITTIVPGGGVKRRGYAREGRPAEGLVVIALGSSCRVHSLPRIKDGKQGGGYLKRKKVRMGGRNTRLGFLLAHSREKQN